MFGKRYTLFRLLGLDVRVDASWLILAVLIVWTLSTGFFPMEFPGMSGSQYLWMGIVGAVGLFLSIVLHETSHAVVARREGIPMKGITLFIFGGVAEMERDPGSASAELRMAIAGPITSVVIAAICYTLYALVGAAGGVFWRGVFGYLAVINIMLAIFNMLPAFPLDGGRVLRAILWKRRNDLRSATRTASNMGAGFGTGLIVLGVISILFGNFIGGMWWFLIGMFLQGASKMSYRQLEVKEALAGETVSRFMQPTEATVSPATSLQDLMDRYFYRHYFNVFPVTEGSKLVGCVDVRQLKSVPREEWATHEVKEIAQPCSSENTVTPNTDAINALTRMSRLGKSWLMVAENGQLSGIVTLRNLLNYVVMKLDLDHGGADPEIRQFLETTEAPVRR
jgi:Zn-dependent protease